MKATKKIKLDKSDKSFSGRCYRLLCRVPKGKVTTYRELARALGTKAYRAVGQVMNKNPHAPMVPCHRVVSSSGKLGGFAQGTKAKIRILKKEGVTVEKGRIADFERRLYRFR